MLKLLRPHQWIKNAFVFAPLIFSENLLNPVLVIKSVIAFASFCLISSSVYAINDIADLEEDRKHPLKKNRPLPAGIVSVRTAAITALILGSTSLLASFTLTLTLGIVAVSYFVLNLLYTFKLKKLVILDVFCIAAGFVLRVVGSGCQALHIR